MRVQEILHQRFIFLVVNGITVSDFHAAAHLGEKEKRILILLQFLFGNSCVRLLCIQHDVQCFTKSTEKLIKILPLLIVSKKHFHLFCVAGIFQARKQFRQPGVGFPQPGDRRHDIHHNPLQVSAVEVLQSGAAVEIHGGVQFFNQSTVVHNEAVVLALMQAVGAGDGLEQTVFLQLLVDVEHLADRGVKAGEQLAAHNENVDVPCAELVLHGLFIGVCVAVAVHHLIPVGNDSIVGSFVCIVYAFPEIRR